MIEWITTLPTWQTIRLLGLVSYGVLALGICLGILYSFPVWKGKTKARLYLFHMYFTNGGTLIGLLHGVVPVIDHYSPFAWREVLIPFAAEQHPVLNGLGTLAAYGTLIVIFTTDIRNKLGKKMWRTIHLLSYPIFAITLIHGFFEGTDSAQPAAEWLYLGSLLAIAALTVFRMLVKPGPKTLRKPSAWTQREFR